MGAEGVRDPEIGGFRVLRRLGVSVWGIGIALRVNHMCSRPGIDGGWRRRSPSLPLGLRLSRAARRGSGGGSAWSSSSKGRLRVS